MTTPTTHRRGNPRLRPGAAARLALGLLGLLLVGTSAACSSPGDDATPEPDELTPAEVLALAQETLDTTSGARLDLTTPELPDGVVGIAEASGMVTHAPAFDGTIDLVLAGSTFTVPVVAVDGEVYATLPGTTGFQKVDPADYGAPDPAALIAPETGFSSLLPATTEVAKGESVRGGADNDEVLTTFTGSVPGDAMKNVIPSSVGDDFDATYLISEAGELRSATFVGQFYPDSADMTYTVEFSDYGSAPEIAAP